MQTDLPTTVSEHSNEHRPTRDDQPAITAHAIVDERDDEPDCCTIYSTAPTDWVVTSWISAHVGSYYAREEIR